MTVRPRLAWLIWAALMVIGVLRIVDTYAFNSATSDEPLHISAGMQWLMEGRYTYEPENPPLARVAAALGPFADRNADFRPVNFVRDAYAIVFKDGNPVRNLTLARLGILPFFVIAGLFVFLWARECEGSAAGIIATFLFANAPPVLAHAALATTDMAVACTVPAALYLYRCALKASSLRTWLSFGLAAGLTLLAKMTALPLLGVCLPALAIQAMTWVRREAMPVRRYIRGTLFPAMVATAAAFLVLWAGYRFSFGPPKTSEQLNPHVEEFLAGREMLRSLTYTLRETPVPAPEYVRGIGNVIAHAHQGHGSYLLGEKSQFGSWFFFPVAVGVKTPLPMLFLLVLGIAAAVGVPPGKGRAAMISALLCAALTMLVMLPSPVKIGVRHILPVYFFLAVIGGCGAIWVFRRMSNRPVALTVAGALLLWQAAASLAAHPDYIPYFNEVAALTDDPILVDSDRDWGQSIYRLQDYVTAHGIEQIYVAVHGLNEESLAGYSFPAFVRLEPHQQRTGWIAVSALFLYLNEGFRWLRDHEPLEVIGKSIYVYRIKAHELRRSGGFVQRP